MTLAKGVVMKSIVTCLAALICAGWATSSVHAFHVFERLRSRGYADAPVVEQTPAPVSQQPANCDPAGGHHHGLPGYLHGFPGYICSSFGRVKAFICSDVPQKPPAPPKPLPINPYLRSPRDFFMQDDP
jgi:hypothetical protein